MNASEIGQLINLSRLMGKYQVSVIEYFPHGVSISSWLCTVCRCPKKLLSFLSYPCLSQTAQMNRKFILIGVAVVVVLVIVIAVPCALLLGKKDDKPTPTDKAKTIKQRAQQILDETPLVDG